MAARSILPRNYKLSVTDLQFTPKWLFKGRVCIDVEVSRQCNEIILHAEGLSITKIICRQKSKDISCQFQYSSKKNALVLDLAVTLEPGQAQVIVEYAASIGNDMAGFFRAMYRVPGIQHDQRSKNEAFVLVTQFEPCFARRAFPCFDEPNLKATFDVEIECPASLTALSNMPVKESARLSGEKQGLKLIKFERTPRMSTYLLAWAIGDLEYVETTTRQAHGDSKVPIRIYTPPGLSRYADLALDCAARVLDLYRELFKIDYPIPKCDQLVVPEFVAGAMENWGLITYKPTKILFDSATSNNRVKAKVAYVIAHELAHQWFGNLVTMDNWAELWLNEGFATWAGYMAVDTLFPEWDIWSQYVAEILDDTFKLDSLPTTHAIVTRVQSETEALQMFDSISYFKGSSVIRMLADQLGQTTFLDGLSRYLKRHAYGNARSQELWSALTDASGMDVALLMDAWIHARGFPIIQVTASVEDVVISQSSVLAPHENGRACLWQIPLGCTQKAGRLVVLGAGASLSIPMASLKSINKDHVSNCCVSYCPKITDHLLSSSMLSASIDLVGLISDASTLVLNGLMPVSQALVLVEKLKVDQDPYLWLSILRLLDLLCSIFYGDSDIASGLKLFAATLIRNMKHRIQWTDSSHKPYRQAEFDKSMIILGSLTADHVIIRESRRRFDAWKTLADTSALGPNLRGVILSTCVSNGTEDDFDFVKRALFKEHILDGQEILLDAMCAVSDPSLAIKMMDLVFKADSKIDLQHIHLVGGALGRNNACRLVQWQYVRRNWIQVWERLKMNATCRDWWIEESFRHFSDAQVAEDMTVFFETRIGSEVAKPVAYIRASIERNARFKENARKDIRDFLKPYATSRI